MGVFLFGTTFLLMCSASNASIAVRCDANLLEAERTKLVSAQLDEYMKAIKRKRFERALAMWRRSEQAREEERRQNIKFMRQSSRSIRILAWSVVRVDFKRDSARVTLLVSGESREEDGHWATHQDPETSYWICEEGAWVFDPAGAASWRSNDKPSTRP